MCGALIVLKICPQLSSCINRLSRICTYCCVCLADDMSTLALQLAAEERLNELSRVEARQRIQGMDAHIRAQENILEESILEHDSLVYEAVTGE